MKKLGVFISIIFLGGCFTVRNYTVEKPRVDTVVEGNQGFLSGTPKPLARENKLGATRKVSVMEVEFGSYKAKAKAKKLEGPDFRGRRIFEDEAEEENLVKIEKDAEEIETEAAGETAPEAGPKNYIVQKNDTLQGISYKFYKTTKRWQKIYEANKNVIKNPDRLYPGAEIEIP